MPFEGSDQPMLSRGAFVGRMLRHIGIAMILIVGGLAVGMAGYRWIAGFSWMDSFLNASMILTSMGPVDHVATDGAKLFAGCYALFSGLVFVTASGVVVAPLLHRVLHRFHIEVDDPSQKS